MAIAALNRAELDHALAELRGSNELGFRFEVELKDGKAPTSFRCFRAGENPSTKGTYVFDESSQVACMAYQERRGMDTMVDYEHASRYATFAVDPQKAGRAAAWCRLECKNGELWCTRVDWTPAGREAVESKEQRFFSPVFAYNKDTLVIGECIQIGLTSTPALDGLQPLAAKNDGTTPEQNKVTPEELKKWLASIAKVMALKADADAVEVQFAIAELVQGREKLFGALKATSVSDALGKIAGLEQNASGLAELKNEIEKGKREAKKMRVDLMIDAAIKELKVAPAQKSFLDKMGDDEEMLKSYLGTLTAIPGAKPLTPPPPGALPAAIVNNLPVELSGLTAEDLHIANLTGHSSPEDLKKLVELKKKHGGVKVGALNQVS